MSNHVFIFILLYSLRPGVAALIDEAIRDGNKITVLTQLPRPVAIQILKKAGLSPLFQGRIDPENLISPMHLADFKSTSTANAAADAQAAQRASIESQNRAQSARAASSGERNASLSVSSLGDREGLRFDGAAVIKCCGLMRKPGGTLPLLWLLCATTDRTLYIICVVLLDRNSQHHNPLLVSFLLISAKRPLECEQEEHTQCEEDGTDCDRNSRSVLAHYKLQTVSATPLPWSMPFSTLISFITVVLQDILSWHTSWGQRTKWFCLSNH